MNAALLKIFIAIRRASYALLYLAGQMAGQKAKAAVVLCYHNIGSNGWYHSVDRDKFLRQLDHLMKNYRALSPSDLKDQVFSRPSFLLTFDDGHRGVMAVRDDMQKRNIKAILFIMADNENLFQKDLYEVGDFLSRDEIKSLLADGWYLGCHGYGHKNVRGLSNEELEKEIVLSKKKLEDKYGVSVEYFSYPNGQYDENAIEQVKKAGYKMAFSMDDGLVLEGTDLFKIPRVGINQSLSFLEFKSVLLPANMLARRAVKKIF
jgi:peptidoglycan/xylan/chitin deacetylase (PgdA/CDA1 family)